MTMTELPGSKRVFSSLVELATHFLYINLLSHNLLQREHRYSSSNSIMRISAPLLQAFGYMAIGYAARLFVSSYSGNITTIDVTDVKDRVDLKAVAFSRACAPSPSWLQYDSKESILYCADEGLSTPQSATFVSLKAEKSGALTPLGNITTLNGGVNTVRYSDGPNDLMAIAH